MELTPVEQQIIIALRETYKGTITIPVADGKIQEPEIRLPVKEFVKATKGAKA